MDLLPQDYFSADNLRKLRLGSTSPAPSRAHPIKGLFLRGPIPLDWLAAAAKLPGKAPVLVALAIRFESGRRRNAQSVKLTNKLVARFGVSRKCKYRAIKSLQQAGLIDVQQDTKKSPVVTILELPSRRENDE